MTANQQVAHPVISSTHVYLITEHQALYDRLSGHLPKNHVLRLLHPEAVLELSAASQVDLLADAAVALISWSEDNIAAMLALKPAKQRYAVPFIALCEASEAEQVAALVVGADAVLAAPYNPIQFQALLIAQQRHRRRKNTFHPSGDGASSARLPDVHFTVSEEHEVSSIGVLMLNHTARRCFVENQVLDLTPREFDLLSFLMRDAGACHSRDDLLEHVWDIDYDTETNILDVHVYNLRRKLRVYGKESMIETVRGVGYRLVDGKPAC